MDSLLFGLRFSSKKNAGKADSDTDVEKSDQKESATEKDAAKDAKSDVKSDKGITLDAQADSQTDSPPQEPEESGSDADIPFNERNNDMRLSKNSPSRTDEDFDIPNEPVVPGYTPSSGLARSSSGSETRHTSIPAAVIGSKITIRGDLSGEEDLLIEGKVEGTVDLTGYHLMVGKSGVVKANLLAKSITIEGTVDGDLIGQERILIKASSHVKGNLVAERVTLEDGSKFRGSIDMESGKATSSSVKTSNSDHRSQNSDNKTPNSDESGKPSKVS